MAGKDMPEQWNRLQHEQMRALQNTDASIDQWMHFKSDFEALKNRLKTLPDTMTHDVMVPFGKMAFMPGQLVHTNEVLVLLGDNWFAERSAKQAAEIVDRRIQIANKNLEDLDKQKQLLLPRQQFTTELEQMSKERGEKFEIREEYDEEKERQWKEAHRKRNKEHRTRLKQEVGKNSTSPASPSELTDEQLWARLDQLEEIETDRREVQKVGTQAEQTLEDFKYPTFLPSKDSSHDNKNIVERDKAIENEEFDNTDSEDEESSYSASDELDSDDEPTSEEEYEQEATNKGTLITFSHSSQQTEDGSCMKTEPSNQTTTITTPADIFKQFAQSSKPKSILKKSSSEPKKKRKQKTRKTVVAFQTGSDDDARNQVTVETATPLETAFSDSVIERSTPTFTIPTDHQTVPHKNQQMAPPRPVSKFKSVSTNQSSDLPKTVQANEMTESENAKPVSRFKAQRQKSKH